MRRVPLPCALLAVPAAAVVALTNVDEPDVTARPRPDLDKYLR